MDLPQGSGAPVIRPLIGCALVALMAAGGWARPVQAQDTHLLVVVGLGGDEEHRLRFHRWATQLVDAAASRYGVAVDRIHYLGEDPDLDPARIRARSTAENIGAAIGEVADVAGPDDTVVIVLIGHGSARGASARFNLPGPDLGPADFDLLLDRLAGRRVAFVNTAASSGGFVSGVAGEGRVVIAATRSAREQNETQFGGHFVAAFVGNDADLDKDGRVSLLEAFRYAAREVERHYEREGLLATEHPVLEDDGDGVGEREPAPPTTEGALAADLYLASMPASVDETAAASPELRELYRRRDSLQARVVELRDVRDGLDPADYERRLEELLVELGLLNREIRTLEGGAPP